MKPFNGFFSILSFCLYFAFTGFAQERTTLPPEVTDQLKEWKEVYFSFALPAEKNINELSNLVSIAQYRNDTIFAFANEKEMRAFLNENINYQLLAHPSLQNPAMFSGSAESLPLAWDFYPTYSAYESMLSQFQVNYPDLCRIDTLCILPSGRKILVAKISDNVTDNEDEPEFLYTSSMHGNELTGYVLMLRLIDYLLTNYGSNPKVTNLVNNIEIRINPLANPDGTYHGGNNTVSGAIRYNANGVDLNRNYPDPQNGPHPDGNTWQAETVAFMNFAQQHHFTMSANFHGGSEVFNYPWDTWAQLPADDAWWYQTGRAYADTIHLYSPSSYFDDLLNGVTNGYNWYEVNGGRQDYMNYFHHCREVTIEISNAFTPSASTLPTFWNYNYRSLLNYMEESLYGLRGIVTDSLTAQPVEARVFIDGFDIDSSHVYSSLPLGNYHRYLASGTYTVTFSAPGYYSKTISGIGVTSQSTTVTDVQLRPHLPSVSGTLTYINTDMTALNAVMVYLKDMNGDTLDVTLTDATGHYLFQDVAPGDYTFDFNCTLSPGGLNSIDALLILRHFVGIETLNGLKRKAGDVDNSNTINSIDALLVQKWFVGLITVLPATPWIFTKDTIQVLDSTVAHSLFGICRGDVNASYLNTAFRHFQAADLKDIFRKVDN